MHWLMIASLWLGAAPTTPRFAGKVPAEGRWFATHSYYEDPPYFAIFHLTPRGLSTVFSGDSEPFSFVWADADTLVTLDSFAPPMTVRWYDAGVLTAEVALPFMMNFAWILTFGASPDGVAWLLDCETAPCKGSDVMRVTRQGVIAFPDEAPPDLRYPSTVGRKPVPVAAPEGHVATVTMVTIDDETRRGVACTSPAGTTTWPNATTPDRDWAVRPWKATWVDVDPPILALRGKSRDLGGEEVTTTNYFRGCTLDPLPDYRVLGDGLWLSGQMLRTPTGETVATWSLWWNDTLIDQMRGDARDVQMAPY